MPVLEPSSCCARALNAFRRGPTWSTRYRRWTFLGIRRRPISAARPRGLGLLPQRPELLVLREERLPHAQRQDGVRPLAAGEALASPKDPPTAALPRTEVKRKASPEVARDYPLILGTGRACPCSSTHGPSAFPGPAACDPTPPWTSIRRTRPGWGSCRVTGGISTPNGAIEVSANVTELAHAGAVHMYHDYPEADVNALLPGDYLDPISGFPGYKGLLCAVREVAPAGGRRAEGPADQPRLLPRPQPVPPLHGLRGRLLDAEQPRRECGRRRVVAHGGASSRSQQRLASRPMRYMLLALMRCTTIRPHDPPAHRCLARSSRDPAVKVNAELCMGCHVSIACPSASPASARTASCRSTTCPTHVLKDPS